jgi:hypothetical protein
MSFLSKLFKKKKEPEPPQAFRPPTAPLAREAGWPPPPPPAAPPAAPRVDTMPLGRVDTRPVPRVGGPQDPSARTSETPRPASTEPLLPLRPTVSHEQDASYHVTLPEVDAALNKPIEPGVTAALGSEPRSAVAAAESAKPSPPPAPTAAATAPPEEGAALSEEFFDDFLDDFDANFDAALGKGPAPAVAAAGAAPVEHGIVYDQSPVRELFADIAANYVRAVRNFMHELKRGDAAREWIDICQPAVNSIKKAAEKMELHDIYKAIDNFDAVLDLASGAEGRMIGGEIREEFIRAYFDLVELMPQAFRLDNERDERESIIIHSLLMQVPEVRKVTVDKIYGAGITSLEVLFLAKPDDLAATAGIPEWLAAKIVDKFQAYRQDSQAITPDAGHSAERGKLATLLSELRKLQDWYERASGAWSPDAAEEKKRLRAARQDTLMQINVVLAQLGEVELIHELEKLPFERRIERIDTYLNEGMIGEVPL